MADCSHGKAYDNVKWERDEYRWISSKTHGYH